MVHIADGILAPEVWISGIILTVVLLAFTLSKVKVEEIPKLSLITAAVFVASLIHVPIGPASVHLILAGLAGVILGWGAFPCVFIAVLLQAFLFQHGGVTTIGINSIIMGLPALISYGIFYWGVKSTKFKAKIPFFGGLAGGIAVALATLFTSMALIFTGEEFYGILIVVAAAHIPVIIIETIIVGSTVSFLSKVKPEMLVGVET